MFEGIGSLSPDTGAETIFKHFGYSPEPHELRDFFEWENLRCFERSTSAVFPQERLNGYLSFGKYPEQDIIAYNLGLNKPSRRYYTYALTWISLTERYMYKQGEYIKLPILSYLPSAGFLKAHDFAQNLLMPEKLFRRDFEITHDYTHANTRRTISELAKAYDVHSRHIIERSQELNLLSSDVR